MVFSHGSAIKIDEQDEAHFELFIKEMGDYSKTSIKEALRKAFRAGATRVHNLDKPISPQPLGMKCPLCKGTGRREQASFSNSRKTIEVHCMSCKGSGHLPVDWERYYKALFIEVKRHLDGECDGVTPKDCLEALKEFVGG